MNVYENKMMEYVASTYTIHMQQIKSLLPYLTKAERVIEPAAGVGMVCRLLPNVESGDMNLTPLTYETVRKEKISETLSRYQEGDVIFLGYCWVFLTELEKSQVLQRPTIILDAVDQAIPACEKIAPGVYITESMIDMIPEDIALSIPVIQEKREKLRNLDYSMNLLQSYYVERKQEQIAIEYDNDSLHYLRSFDPGRPIATPFRHPSRREMEEARIFLVSSYKELIDTWERRGIGVRIFFLPIGKELEVHYCTMLTLVMVLKPRQVYSVKRGTIMEDLFHGFPGIQYQDQLFFHTEEGVYPRSIKTLRTAGNVVLLSTEDETQCEDIGVTKVRLSVRTNRHTLLLKRNETVQEKEMLLQVLTSLGVKRLSESIFLRLRNQLNLEFQDLERFKISLQDESATEQFKIAIKMEDYGPLRQTISDLRIEKKKMSEEEKDRMSKSDSQIQRNVTSGMIKNLQKRREEKESKERVLRLLLYNQEDYEVEEEVQSPEG